MRISQIKYSSEHDRIELSINSSISSSEAIFNDFENYLKDPSRYMKNGEMEIDEIINLFMGTDIDISSELVKSYLLNYTRSFFCYGTTIFENADYDFYLKEWLGDYKWKLLYRASEHDYTAKSFHDCCDEKTPTLIIIKSSGGWIFGGYTTQSWSGHRIYI